MNYPKTVRIEDPKLLKMLQEKEQLILIGREKSQEIEDCENDMAIIDTEIQAIEKTVDIKDLEGKAKDITDRMNAVVGEMEALKKDIYKRMSQAVPKDLTDQYEKKTKLKEKLEHERNKIGLNVQKKLDKILPLGRKLMRKYLERKGDDYDSLRMENGEIVGTIFNHYDDFDKAYTLKNPL